MGLVSFCYGFVWKEGRIFDENGYDPEGLDRQEI